LFVPSCIEIMVQIMARLKSVAKLRGDISTAWIF
jgi:hypothetical protein